ncbi:MAG: hypothetical protein OH316_01355 [Candidatus Parvarchaeota archaeon]|nr:hypothetical protein [Candidatus Parvarchaeota archaeon]
MRSDVLSGRRGATVVETVTVLVILIIFAIVSVLIIRSGFLSSLFPSSRLVYGNTTIQCSITAKELSSSATSCTYLITASQGTSGAVYYLYGQGREQCSYLAGDTKCSQEVSISNYAVFKCNTSGLSSGGAQITSPGGAYQVNVSCGG